MGWTPLHWTSNELEHVHNLVINLNRIFCTKVHISMWFWNTVQNQKKTLTLESNLLIWNLVMTMQWHFHPILLLLLLRKKYSRFLCNYSFLFVPFTITFKISKKRLNCKPSNKAAKNISHGKNSHALTKIFCKHTLIGIGKLPIEKFVF